MLQPKYKPVWGCFLVSHLAWSPKHKALPITQEEKKDCFPAHFVVWEFENPEGKWKEDQYPDRSCPVNPGQVGWCWPFSLGPRRSCLPRSPSHFQWEHLGPISGNDLAKPSLYKSGVSAMTDTALKFPRSPLISTQTLLRTRLGQDVSF